MVDTLLWLLCSAVGFTADEVDGVKGWDDVCQHGPFNHFVYCGDDIEARRSDFDSPRFFAPERDDVEAQLTVAAFNITVCFSRWDFQVLGDGFEV